VLTHLIERVVHTTLADGYVLPHRYVHNFEKNLPLETMIEMKSPLPLGVLRIEVLEGKGLPAGDTNFLTGLRNSDVFVQVKVGLDTARTSTVSDTVDPVWKEPPGYLFVYNLDQIVQITVKDDDLLADDVLGSVLGYNVFLLCQACAAGKSGDAWLDVTDPYGQPAGSLRVRTGFFEIGDLGSYPAPTQPPSDLEPPYFLTVKLLGLDCPPDENLTGARVTIEFVADGAAAHEAKESHHAKRLVEGLVAAEHYAQSKVRATSRFGFGNREEGAPSKRRSGKAIPWGSERRIMDTAQHTCISPMTIRAMETLHVNEGFAIKDIAEMFGVQEQTVYQAVSMRGNFEVIWGDAQHFLQPASIPVSGKIKVSVHAPTANRVRGSDASGLVDCFELSLPIDSTWGTPWSSRVTRKLRCGQGPGESRSKSKEAANEAADAAIPARASSVGSVDSSSSRLGRPSLGRLLRGSSRNSMSSQDSTGGTGDAVGAQEANESDSGISIEMLVEIRKLVGCACTLPSGQSLRSREDLVQATKDSGVRIKTV
jgi:hypothetical protein